MTIKCTTLRVSFKLECLWLIFRRGEQVWESAGYSAESVSCDVLEGGSWIGKGGRNTDAKQIQNSKCSATNIQEVLYSGILTFSLESRLLQVCQCLLHSLKFRENKSLINSEKINPNLHQRNSLTLVLWELLKRYTLNAFSHKANPHDRSHFFKVFVQILIAKCAGKMQRWNLNIHFLYRNPVSVLTLRGLTWNVLSEITWLGLQNKSLSFFLGNPAFNVQM